MGNFVPRQRKHKVRQRHNQGSSGADPNTTELVPESRSERDDRRTRLQEETKSRQPASKITSKKRKRLDKYIDSKLRKDEANELIRKLSAQKTDTDLLRSSKKLGSGKDSRRETLFRALQQSRAGVNKDANHDILFERQEEDDNLIPESKDNSENERGSPNGQLEVARVKTAPISQSFGAGLKRPLDTDTAGNPIIKRRKRIKENPMNSTPETDDAPDWEGFSATSGSVEVGSESGLSESDASSQASASSENLDCQLDRDREAENESPFASKSEEQEDEVGSKQHDRTSAFKAWATRLRNDAIGFQPSTQTSCHDSFPETSSAREKSGHPVPSVRPARDPRIKEVLEMRPGDIKITAFNVPVSRTTEVNESRSQLPVVAEEQRIMETIQNNDCTIICGETGSGKTTQIPQFLFEAGYGHPKSSHPGMIGITQPRRVAAVSMAQRVAYELGDLHSKVSHQVRFSTSTSKETTVKFMTDGVLLREASKSLQNLSKYSVIIIDEAHERSVNTDILIGMLCRIAETSKAFKLVIMSATLRMNDFVNNPNLSKSGKTPPVIQIEGRQHDVTVHFARRTRRDYVEDMFEKVSKGHRKLPPGGMLVFLTGQPEIQLLAQKLQQSLGSGSRKDVRQPRMRVSAAEDSIENEDFELSRFRKSREGSSESDVSLYGVDGDETAGSDNDDFEIEEDQCEKHQSIHILPLYAQLPHDQQKRVFEPAPEGSRMIVLATNVAETSLTIPGIRYVFDCGRAKEKRYDTSTGVQSFDIEWISKANASQRAGRAGRSGPGHCYRLYSSAVFERDFEEHPAPEILRVAVDGVVLKLCNIGIPVNGFPFPTPPNPEALSTARTLLENLGAIQNGKLTQLGEELDNYPLSPRLSRILAVAQQRKCQLDHVVSLVAILTTPDIYIPENQLKPSGDLAGDDTEGTAAETHRKEHNRFHATMSRYDRHSDATKLLTTLSDFAQHQTTPPHFKTFTRVKALSETLQLRAQLHNLIAAQRHITPPRNQTGPILTAPSPPQLDNLRHLAAAGFTDQIAQRADLSPTPPPLGAKRPSRAVHVPYITLFGSHEEKARSTGGFVHIHAASVLARLPPASLPRFVAYSHLSLAAASSIPAPDDTRARVRMHPLAPLSAEQIVELAEETPLLREGKPMKWEKLERGESGEERREVLSVPFLKGEAGGREWPLPLARRVVQRRVGGGGWVVEKVL